MRQQSGLRGRLPAPFLLQQLLQEDDDFRARVAAAGVVVPAPGDQPLDRVRAEQADARPVLLDAHLHEHLQTSRAMMSQQTAMMSQQTVKMSQQCAMMSQQPATMLGQEHVWGALEDPKQLQCFSAILKEGWDSGCSVLKQSDRHKRQRCTAQSCSPVQR